MLQASVAQDPVTDDMQESQSQARCSPYTVAGRSKMAPLPPARCTHQPIIAMAAIGAAISLVANK